MSRIMGNLQGALKTSRLLNYSCPLVSKQAITLAAPRDLAAADVITCHCQVLLVCASRKGPPGLPLSFSLSSSPLFLSLLPLRCLSTFLSCLSVCLSLSFMSHSQTSFALPSPNKPLTVDRFSGTIPRGYTLAGPEGYLILLLHFDSITLCCLPHQFRLTPLST